MLTAQDLAYESFLPLRAIYALMNSGALAYLKVGNRRYIQRAEWERCRRGTRNPAA
jgi:hypothetical protein